MTMLPPDTVDDVDASAHRVATRAGQTIDQNSREAGVWRRAPAAAAAVRQERERPLSTREIERFEATWTAILTQMGRRHAPDEEVERVARWGMILARGCVVH